jgi:hypothetical protein
MGVLRWADDEDRGKHIMTGKRQSGKPAMAVASLAFVIRIDGRSNLAKMKRACTVAAVLGDRPSWWALGEIRERS